MPSRPRVALALLITLAAAVTAIAPLAARTAPQADAPAAALAAQPARAPITVSLEAGTVEWRTAPYADVTASWYAGAVRRFRSTGFADSAGHVVIGALDSQRPNGLFMEGVDRLVLGVGLGDGPTFDVPLPPLDAEVDAPGDAVELRAAPGAAVPVRIRRAVDADVLALGGFSAFNAQSGGSGPFSGNRPPDALGPPLWSGDAVVDAAGRARVAVGGALDIRPGDVAEVVRTVGADTFVLRRAAFQLLVVVGSEFPKARGRPGESVALSIGDGAGREDACAALVGAGGDASWRCARIDAGERITVTHTGRLLPAARSSATVPRLGFRPAAGGAPAMVSGPPGGRLRFAEVSPLGATSGEDVALDQRGEAAMAAGRPAPGARYAVAWSGADGGIVIGGPTGFVPQVRLMLGEPRVRGTWPAAAVTVTVAAADGAPFGRWSKPRWMSDDVVPLFTRDAFEGVGDLHRLAPGDRVEVTVGGDEPLAWTLPDLELRFDADTGRLSGRLPAATIGALSILEPIDGDADPFRAPADLTNGRFVHRATVPLHPDADGRFDVALGDLRGPDGRPVPTHRLVQGVVTATRADGTALAEVFGTPWLDLDFQDAQVEGFGPAGQAVALEVAGPSGVVEAVGRAEAQDAVSIDEPHWLALLEDRFGVSSPLRPGDLVTVTVGPSRATLRVPALEGYVDLEAGRVRGRAAPGAPVRVALYGDGVDVAWQPATAGPDGSFDVPVPDAAAALRIGDLGDAQARFGSHNLMAPLVVPTIVIDLSAGRIWGRGPARASVRVDLQRGGRTVASGRRIVDDWQSFDVDPRDAAGNRVPPSAGDVIVQRVDGLPVVTATVPAFTAAWDRAAGRIVGQAPAGSTLERRPSPFYIEPDPTWLIGSFQRAPSGAFSLEARHPRGAAAGLTEIISARAPSGVEALRWVVAPVLNVPLGGESVCGQAMPWAVVQAEAALRDGRTVRGVARANSIGRFRVPLDGEGRPVALASGDVVRATVDGASLESTTPLLALTVDRTRGSASGRAPAGAQVSIEGPGGSCDAAFDQARFGVFEAVYSFADVTNADAAGAFTSRLPEPNYPYSTARPRAYEAAIRDAAGHRIFRVARALRVTAWIDTPFVLGEADSGARVDVTLARPDGLTARAVAVADATGHFTATLAAADGAAPRVREGDRIEAGTGDEVRRLTIPPLAVDWYPERGIVGRTDGGATVDVRFVLPPGHLLQRDTDVAFTLAADDAGRFASPLTPARGVWTLDDVRRVEVWRSFDGDDRAMVAFDTQPSAPSPTPTAARTPDPRPTPPGPGRLWLPWVGRGTGR